MESQPEGIGSGARVREGKTVVPLELFYDLVFVFAVTQVSHLLLDDLSWQGATQAVVAFGVVSWAWNYTVWVTSEVDLDPVPVRLLILAMMLASLVMAVAVPEAFGRYSLLFVASYLAIKIGRLLFLTVGGAHADSLGPGRAARLIPWFAASGVFWVAGGFADGPLRIAFWIVALGIDDAGPLLLYRTPGHPPLQFSQWKVELTHLAERYETFVIIALGESIVFIGATVSARGIEERFVAFALAFASTACLYWLYFDGFPRVARQHLRLPTGGVRLARDAYMYLHPAIVGGIILSAVGDGLVIEHAREMLDGAQVAVIVAGPAVYLLGHALFRHRITGSISRLRIAGAVACLAVGLLGAVVPGLVLSALLVAVLVAVIAGERVSRSEPARRPGTVLTPGPSLEETSDRGRG